MLRTEPKNSYDQAPSAILELVDGPRDMRWHLTAAAVARERALRGDKSDPAAWITTDSGGKEGPVTKGLREITAKNVKKVTRYRKDGVREFEALVERMRNLGFGDAKKAA